MRTTRRDCLEWMGALAGTLVLPAAFAGENGPARREDHKTLTLYYSWSGSSATVAREVHRILGGDLLRIETEKAYPTVYEEMTKVAMSEERAGARPALKTALPDVSRYDTIVLGHPIWHGRMPMAFYTLLEALDLAGRDVLHWTTNGGSGLGDSHAELARLQPSCRLLEPLSVYGWGGVRDLAAVGTWLRRVRAQP